METSIWVALLLLFVAGFHLGEGSLSISPTYDFYYLLESAQLQLTCKSTRSSPTFSWTKDNSAIPSADVSQNATGSYYSKSMASFSDSGSYACNDGAGNININVKVFSVATTSGNYSSRSNPITLTCQPNFNGPAPSYNLTWKREDGRDISDTTKYFQNGTSLVITAPSFSSTTNDGGVYYCGFKFYNNPSQEVSKQVYVYTGPLVRTLGKSLIFTEGQTSYIDCNVVSYPMASITWLYENVTITNSRVTYKSHGGYSNGRLEIAVSQRADRGTYTCMAYNPQLQTYSSKTVFLRVKDHLAWLWPLIGIAAEILVLILIVLIANYKCPKTQPTSVNSAQADNAEPQPGTSRASLGDVRKRTTNL